MADSALLVEEVKMLYPPNFVFSVKENISNNPSLHDALDNNLNEVGQMLMENYKAISELVSQWVLLFKPKAPD